LEEANSALGIKIATDITNIKNEMAKKIAEEIERL